MASSMMMWKWTGSVSCIFLCLVSWVHALEGIYDVTEFGAKGDGRSDNTAAFQECMNKAAEEGGGVVLVPRGRFLMRGNLNVPKNVTLEGIWRAPQRGDPVNAGSVLMPVAGKGDEEGTPFLSLNTQSTLKGLTIYYPEQVRKNPPHPYPWTVQGEGDNCTILHVTMINPYQAVDFGSKFCGRHYVNGLYAQALFKGIYINQCYDVGRIENVHFWPFWDTDPSSPTWEFTRTQGTAFLFGKVDGEMALNCFSIFYNTGMHFFRGSVDGGEKTSPGCGVFTNCYMDITPCAVRVDDVGASSGISFVNGMFMSGVQVAPSNKGQVKFVGCGFWANREQTYHACLEGKGTVFFNGCHFSNWDRQEKGVACIQANCEGLIVLGCEFETNREDHWKISLGSQVKSAIISSNRMAKGVLVEDRTSEEADVQIGLNTGL